jgi:WhiB family redox-sensing transcriptional regulator
LQYVLVLSAFARENKHLTTLDRSKIKLINWCRTGFCTRDLGQVVKAMDWRHQSACRDEDPELFFPVGNTGPAITQIEEAKKVCNRCIVKDACLAWALESGQDAGVWGGLSEDERRALKRRAARNRARLQEQQNQF